MTTKLWASPKSLKTSCRWFRGDVPCTPHKVHGVHCVNERGDDCPHFDPVTSSILLIKLGAVGDVIRTTPLLRRLKALYPHAQIWWLTLTPEIVPGVVDIVLPFTPQALVALEATHFDIVYNLDKDREACGLTAALSASVKKGFTLRNGKPAPIDADAAPKFMTGVFDDLNQDNLLSYPEEIFAICGLKFEGEEYILDNFSRNGYRWKFPARKPVIGLNTGCGGRWVTRLWPDRSWISLARNLKKAGYAPLLLGGPQEHLKNRRIARLSGALYPGHFPLPQFINLVDQCTLVVTGVTMAMHIAIGLKKKIVLFNNIFNRHEFELYGLGEILEPEGGCTCFFGRTCTNPAYMPGSCMRAIDPGSVEKAVVRLVRAS